MNILQQIIHRGQLVYQKNVHRQDVRTNFFQFMYVYRFVLFVYFLPVLIFVLLP